MNKVVKYLGEKAVGFIMNHADTIFSITGTVCVGILCKKFNIPVTTNVVDSFYRQYAPTNKIVIVPRNSSEAAVYSIYKSTKNMLFDGDKIKAADEISEIIAKINDIDDETRAFAITIISKIAEDMYFDSSKQKINKIIAGIVGTKR